MRAKRCGNLTVDTSVFLAVQSKKVRTEMKIAQLQQDTQPVHVHQPPDNSDLILERDALRQENQLFKTAIDEWSRRFEEIRLNNDDLTKYDFPGSLSRSSSVFSSRQLSERDALLTELANRHDTARK